jgi:hypothetical protein
MFGVKTSCRAAIPGGGEWPGQALQDDTIPQGAGGGWGWVGGKYAGITQSPRDFLSSIRNRKRQKWHFQELLPTKNGIFALFK